MEDGKAKQAAKPITKTYIIDNCSLHTVYFVEAVAADFEPLFALYAKAWPETCLRCNSTYYQCRCKYREMAETCHIIAVSPSFDWRVGKAMTVVDWLEAIEPSIGENVADIEAAKAFIEMARRWLSWFCEYRSLEFELRGRSASETDDSPADAFDINLSHT